MQNPEETPTEPSQVEKVLPKIAYKVDDAGSLTEFKPKSLEELPPKARIVGVSECGAISDNGEPPIYYVVAHSYLNTHLTKEEAQEMVIDAALELEQTAPEKILALFAHLEPQIYSRARERIENKMMSSSRYLEVSSQQFLYSSPEET